MHTTQNSHHRIFVSNVTDQKLLDDIMTALGIDKADDVKDAYDLVQVEGESLEIGEAMFAGATARGLIFDHEDAEFVPTVELVDRYLNLAKEFNIDLLSSTFVIEKHLCDNFIADTDIDCNELFDILNILGHGRFKVDGIFTQYAMYSDKSPYGANVGGTHLTSQYFCMPTPFLLAERAETVVRTLAKHDHTNVGSYFVNEFIMPILDRVYHEEYCENIMSAIMNFVWSKNRVDMVVSDPKDKGDVAGNEVPMEKTGPDLSQVPSDNPAQFGFGRGSDFKF